MQLLEEFGVGIFDGPDAQLATVSRREGDMGQRRMQYLHDLSIG